MAFGTGSAIAHRAVGAVAASFGGGAAPAAGEPAAAAAPASSAARGGQDCAPFMKDFTACVQENRDSIAACQMYMDNFNQCNADAARLH
jgi:hypothetical protein